MAALRLETNGNELDIPLAYIEEAIAFAVAHGWRPPSEEAKEEVRNRDTIPVPAPLTHDFKDGNGPVPSHQHPNGLGWVANTATVEDTAYVGPNAWVFGDALVSGDARVYGNARVFGAAQVFGNARVSGCTWVFDNAKVFGCAWVFDNARVSKGDLT